MMLQQLIQYVHGYPLYLKGDLHLPFENVPSVMTMDQLNITEPQITNIRIFHTQIQKPLEQNSREY
jgi:hypothetical protein